jgi:uncharacterized OB-fold protein
MSGAQSVPPQPLPDLDTEGFWQATARGELALCRCQTCHLWLQPPLERCSSCAGPTAFEPVSGTGRVFSYIVVRHPAVAGFDDQLPMVVAMIELDEQVGLRLSARIAALPEEVEIGARVTAELVPIPGGPFTYPVFRLT